MYKTTVSVVRSFHDKKNPARQAFYVMRNRNFLLQKSTLSTGRLRSVPRVSLMHIPYFILYDLTSVRRHLEFRSEHFTRTAAHEHAL